MLSRPVAVAAAVLVVAAGAVGGVMASSGKAERVAAHPTTTVPATRPVPTTAPAPDPPTSSPSTDPATTAPAGPTMRYADEASADVASYAADAWCTPLQDASGRTLATLERDVAGGTEPLSSLSSPAMADAVAPSLGQVTASPLARQTATVDLATATAVVPASVDPNNVVVRTAYCVAAPAPLTGYQVSAKGGAVNVDFEAAYSLADAGHVGWWHLWWSTSVDFGPCGQGVCMTGWKLPGASVSYWAVQERSASPKYVVPALDGAWDLSYPPS